MKSLFPDPLVTPPKCPACGGSRLMKTLGRNTWPICTWLACPGEAEQLMPTKKGTAA